MLNTWNLNESLISYMKTVPKTIPKANETEIYNNLDKIFKISGPGLLDNNKISLTIPQQKDGRHYLGSISIINTAGNGGYERLSVSVSDDLVWEESFTTGIDFKRQFGDVPIVTDYNQKITFEVSADDLSAGQVYVTYYTK